MTTLYWQTVLGVLTLSYVFYGVLQWINFRRRLPPGPLGLPWIGNSHQIPSIKPWRTFAEWNKIYGE